MPVKILNLTKPLVFQVPIVGDIQININIEPDRTITADEQCKTHQQEAEALADILFEHLPGGVLDRVMIKLLQHTADLYKHSLS